jgi:hypothetical protein
MCPFCVGTALWIAAGAVSTASVSVLTASKFWNKSAREREQGGSNGQHQDEQ